MQYSVRNTWAIFFLNACKQSVKGDAPTVYQTFDILCFGFPSAIFSIFYLNAMEILKILPWNKSKQIEKKQKLMPI